MQWLNYSSVLTIKSYLQEAVLKSENIFLGIFLKPFQGISGDNKANKKHYQYSQYTLNKVCGNNLCAHDIHTTPFNIFVYHH